MLPPIMLPRVKDALLIHLILDPRSDQPVPGHPAPAVARSRLRGLGEGIIQAAVYQALYEMYPMAEEDTILEYRAAMLTVETLDDWARRHGFINIFDKNPIDKIGSDMHTTTCAYIFQAYTAAAQLDHGSDAVALSIRSLARHWQWASIGEDSDSDSDSDSERISVDAQLASASKEEDYISLDVGDVPPAFPLSNEADDGMDVCAKKEKETNSGAVLPPLAAFNQRAIQLKKNVVWNSSHVGADHLRLWTVEILMDGKSEGIATSHNVREAKDAAARAALTALGWK